jgi:hypothetical protein
MYDITLNVPKEPEILTRRHARYAAIAVLEELHGSANILLAYFHYCAVGGSLSFAKGWTSPSDIAMARLSDDQASFLQRTSNLVKDKGWQPLRTWLSNILSIRSC